MADDKGVPNDEQIERLKKRIERERKARLEAESVAERITRELYDKLQQLEQVNQDLVRFRAEILRLSTPVMQVWDQVVALPVIGTFDTERAEKMTETLLEEIVRRKAQVVIVDVSGVPVMDTSVAQHLIKTAYATRLMGASTIISGIRADTAQTIVQLGIDMSGIGMRANLRDALQFAFEILSQAAAI